MYGNLGLDRHQGRFMMSYLDGHARPIDDAYLQQFTIGSSGASGDFMLRYNKTCPGNSKDHSTLISPAVVE